MNELQAGIESRSQFFHRRCGSSPARQSPARRSSAWARPWRRATRCAWPSVRWHVLQECPWPPAQRAGLRSRCHMADFVLAWGWLCSALTARWKSRSNAHCEKKPRKVEEQVTASSSLKICNFWNLNIVFQKTDWYINFSFQCMRFCWLQILSFTFSSSSKCQGLSANTLFTFTSKFVYRIFRIMNLQPGINETMAIQERVSLLMIT